MRRNNFFDEHTLDVVKAAMPHVHPRAQGGMKVLLKTSDLMSTIENGGQDEEISAMDLEAWKPEPEELLLSIKEVAYPQESDMLDVILNMFKARKLYSAYQAYSEEILEAQGLGGNNNRYRNNNPFNMFNAFNPFNMFGMNPGMGPRGNPNRNQANNRNAGREKVTSTDANTANTANATSTGNATGNQNGGQMPNFFNFLMSQMSPEQKQTFDMLNMMMNNMPNNPGNVKSQSVSEKDAKEDNSTKS